MTWSKTSKQQVRREKLFVSFQKAIHLTVFKWCFLKIQFSALTKIARAFITAAKSVDNKRLLRADVS